MTGQECDADATHLIKNGILEISINVKQEVSHYVAVVDQSQSFVIYCTGSCKVAYSEEKSI